MDVSIKADSRYIAARNRQHGVLQDPCVRSRSKLPNLSRHGGVNPEAAQDIELVVKDGEAAGQSYPVRVAGPGRINGFDCIGEGVETENAGSSGDLSACRAAHAVDITRSRVVKDAASHVAHLVVRKRGGLDSPTIGGRIVFKWVREIVADPIHAAAADGVKLGVTREIDANHAHPGTRHVWPRGPVLPAGASLCMGLPRAQRERDHAHSQQQRQVKPASNKMRSSVRVDLSFDKQGLLFSHCRVCGKRKLFLLKVRQRCRDFSALFEIPALETTAMSSSSADFAQLRHGRHFKLAPS